jgi:hypothetical protein
MRPSSVARFGLIACLPLAAMGCFTAPKAPPSEKTCESNCDRQVKLGCAKSEPDLETTCKQACLIYRVDYPNCVAQMDAMSGCVEDKVTFSCDANGKITTDPIAICMDEEYACYACTGEFAPCRN